MEYRTVKVVDSRTCFRCGGRYGFCPHTEGKRMDSTLDVPRKNEGSREPRPDQWPKDRIERLLRLYNAEYTPTEIAEALNTTRGAVSGQLTRLGVYRSAAA